MPLSIEQVRSALASFPKVEVDVPDLGGTVLVRALNLKEVREIQEMQDKKTTQPIDTFRKMVECAAINEEGGPLFIGGDKALLETLPSGAVKALAEAIMKL